MKYRVKLRRLAGEGVPARRDDREPAAEIPSEARDPSSRRHFSENPTTEATEFHRGTPQRFSASLFVLLSSVVSSSV